MFDGAALLRIELGEIGIGHGLSRTESILVRTHRRTQAFSRKFASQRRLSRSEHSMNAGPGHAHCTPEPEQLGWWPLAGCYRTGEHGQASLETPPCPGAFVPLENQDASLSPFAAMVPSRMRATLGSIGPWFFESRGVSFRESKKGRGTRTAPGQSMLVSQPLTADHGRGRPAG